MLTCDNLLKCLLICSWHDTICCDLCRVGASDEREMGRNGWQNASRQGDTLASFSIRASKAIEGDSLW